MTAGIYVIVNTVNNHFYIGRAGDVESRWDNHLEELRGGISNRRFQRAWNKYGEDAFEFRLYEEWHLGQLIAREQMYLDWWVGLNCCYNISNDAEGGTTKPVWIDGEYFPTTALGAQASGLDYQSFLYLVARFPDRRIVRQQCHCGTRHFNKSFCSPKCYFKGRGHSVWINGVEYPSISKASQVFGSDLGGAIEKLGYQLWTTICPNCHSQTIHGLYRCRSCRKKL